MASKQTGFARWADAYAQPDSRAWRAIEREVIGANVGANGYTTVAQAEQLAGRLALGPGARLLDVGAGRGWPGLYLAERTGCDVVVTDVPAAGLRDAFARTRRSRLARRASFARASGAKLPFRPRTFDAVVHTDVL